MHGKWVVLLDVVMHTLAGIIQDRIGWMVQLYVLRVYGALLHVQGRLEVSRIRLAAMQIEQRGVVNH